MDLDLSHPEIADLARRAKRRIPHFAWEYLDSAAGDETAHRLNRTGLCSLRLMPRVLVPPQAPDLGTEFLGRRLVHPFGISPVGMSGMIWPGAERMLAGHAADQGFPYCLSTVATVTPEDLAGVIGDQGWFQLYPPKDPEIRRDMLKRAADAGFHTLVLTVDVPVPSRRERQRRARLSNPMKLSLPVLWQAAIRPEWALRTLSRGMPRLATMEKYLDVGTSRPSTEHAGHLIRTIPDWDYLEALRAEWDGHLMVKGILHPEDAVQARDAGADAIWVSNHGGRQLSSAPASIACLPAIRAALGPDCPIVFDSGIRSGTDILRAIALGADLVMLGRAYHYGAAAFGERGIAHVTHILREELIADMGQLGIHHPLEARGLEITGISEDGVYQSRDSA